MNKFPSQLKYFATKLTTTVNSKMPRTLMKLKLRLKISLGKILNKLGSRLAHGFQKPREGHKTLRVKSTDMGPPPSS